MSRAPEGRKADEFLGGGDREIRRSEAICLGKGVKIVENPGHGLVGKADGRHDPGYTPDAYVAPPPEVGHTILTPPKTGKRPERAPPRCPAASHGTYDV
jgi:hypothetical protein